MSSNSYKNKYRSSKYSNSFIINNSKISNNILCTKRNNNVFNIF